MKAWALLIAAGGIALASAGQATAPYSSLLVFGDSLTDSGNARLGSLAMGLPDPAPPALGYYGGRFSNGYNFADDLGLRVTGTPATAYLAGGSNFSVGGADASGHPGDASPDFLSQLAIFAGSGQTISSNALVLVTFGGNDIRDVVTNTGAVDFTPTITALATGLAALTQAGARNIVVTGLPDIGALPVTHQVASALGDPNIVTVATQRSLFLNAQFEGVSQAVAAASGADVQFFDLLGFENSLLADPAAFGLPDPLNTTTPCLLAGVAAVAGGCEGYLYFDTIHPTTQVHLAIADAIERQVGLVPEPASWGMMVAGFGLIGAAARRRSVKVRFAV